MLELLLLLLLLGRSDCPALRGLALAGHLDVLTAQEGMRLDQSKMASLRSAQHYVPIALVGLFP